MTHPEFQHFQYKISLLQSITSISIQDTRTQSTL